MNGWFLYRNNQQYGPYTSEELINMEAQGQLYPGDSFKDPASGQWLPADQARGIWFAPSPENPQPAYTPQPDYPQVAPVRQKRKRKKHGCLFTLLSFVLVAAGVFLYFSLTKASGNMTLGKKQAATQQVIASTGGTITVSNAQSPVNGMTITVPSGAYDESKKFKISTQAIKSHTFGANFTPVTPLINIDNGHAFANETMTVSIPISIASDEFAMAFYYDKKTGELEGVPIVSLDNTHITIAANHFCDIAVAKVKKNAMGGLDIETGFKPGLDDWQFVNRGSEIAQGGHCAGQSISAMWYYYERYLGSGDRRLYGLFDDNNYGYNTKNFWQDDSWAYRFASATQANIDWDSRMRDITTTLGNVGDNLTYLALEYAMMMTGEPQYISIAAYKTDTDGKTNRLGHAIIAYRIADGKIYTDDPNYPGATNRFITYAQSTLKPYSSGLNADDINDGNAVLFTEIRYLAKSAMVDWGKMSALYSQMLDGTVGNDLFPAITYDLLVKYNEVTGESKWEKCPTEIKTDADTTAKVNEQYRGKAVIQVSSGYNNQYSSLYTGLEPVQTVLSRSPGPNGYVMYIITLKKGVNDIGILTEFKNSAGKYKYSEFQRIKIIYDQQMDLEFTQDEYRAFTLQKTQFKAIAGDAPDNVEYVWNFGDGTDEVKTEKPAAEHVYKAGGDYTVRLQGVSKKSGEVYAEVITTVEVLDLYGTWKLDYKIEEAGAVDNILNFILKGIVTFINSIFDTGTNPNNLNVTIEGTVIGCELTAVAPADGTTDGAIDVRLHQLTSSTDYVDPSPDIWLGKMTVNGDEVVIKFTGSVESGTGDYGIMTYKGRLSGNSIDGTFDAVMYSGSFSAQK